MNVAQFHLYGILSALPVRLKMNLFEPSAPPRTRARNRIHAVAIWWTWSKAFRQELPDLLEFAKAEGVAPQIAHIPGLRRYDYTFSAIHSEAGIRWADKLRPWALALDRVRTAERIILMRDLLLPRMSSADLRILFSGFRDALTPNLVDASGTLYAPLGDVGGEPTEFPLHCDLYIPQRLWNVFDDVASIGQSGSSIFLQTSEMLTLAKQSGVGPGDVRQLRDSLQVSNRDCYDEFYRLLYSNHPGFSELDRKMRTICFRIRLQRGEAYLIDDRIWMHGRTLTARSVTENRLHRLIF